MSKDRVPTSEKLANFLESLKDPRLTDMIKKARDGYYDNYKTTIPFPTIQLVLDFEEAGYQELAEEAKKGRWDSQDWEGEEWFEKEGRYLLLGEIQKEGGTHENN